MSASSMTQNPVPLEKRLQDLRAFIAQATDSLERGVMVDLKNLQGDVARLCTDIARAGPAQAVPMKPLLAETIAALDHLEQALIAHQKKLQSKGSA